MAAAVANLSLLPETMVSRPNGCDLFYGGGKARSKLVGQLGTSISEMTDGLIPFPNAHFECVVSNHQPTLTTSGQSLGPNAQFLNEAGPRSRSRKGSNRRTAQAGSAGREAQLTPIGQASEHLGETAPIRRWSSSPDGPGHEVLHCAP